MLTTYDMTIRGIDAVSSIGMDAKGQWATALAPFMQAGGITTPRRVAAFLGQVAVESGGFTTLEEDLDYTGARARIVWPDHFLTPASVIPCAHDPEALANVVYAGRMGNGGPLTGDGWAYRGSGLIQLTGKANQLAFAASAGVDPATVGDYLRTRQGAAQSAVWFWRTMHNCNAMADAWALTQISKAINGGTSQLTARIQKSNKALKAIGA